jgi:ribosome-associated heat shock protein Hsp15
MIRLDIWLDVACLFKTRSEAQRACKLGQVKVNGAPAKPHRDLKIGDTLEIQRPLGRRQSIAVLGLADAHIAKAEARKLYEDRTPPATPDEIELRRMTRLFRAAVTPPARPDRRQRRALRQARGKS